MTTSVAASAAAKGAAVGGTLNRSLLASAKAIIPPLSADRHKGQAGRIGIVGGSKDYTGAPFFASMSSMRFGADMAYTVCTPEAGNVIKTYSPDLIVNRILDPQRTMDDVRDELAELMQRLHAVVVGPGMGRDDFMQGCAEMVVKLAREQEKYLVIDADGLWLLQNKPDLIRGYRRAILTPNVAEFARLCKACQVDNKTNPDDAAKRLAIALDGPTILEKGKVDRITDGKEVLNVDLEGGLKRSGGQGDILAGCLGTFAGWCKVYEEEVEAGTRRDDIPRDKLLLFAGYGAAVTARTCSRLAFREKGRALLADDLLPVVGKAYQQLFESDDPQASL
ncbi:uncharacterized protein PFL1_02697 [Pseudozyma flocculosa PF-1]|uniref:ATP-dependent (S)-NAD(P)H-hydrate dehydratase n=2 Tax=Pseudozyma flocculosa TaxID=84751 RepID=A0A5C3F1K5_9BASI|nr:uncharacterized protein PFL1_02697 [Pseudozyma flocculosa PF-1]EPQ30024.1 hypothetical protein PFL1_02697 [Pseudozyma flocculosa PF-1]SPO37349.1 probable ATP-dependent (S)-NAD(P)H-hydrate dehydratase [Pseudozyma flocculosa]